MPSSRISSARRSGEVISARRALGRHHARGMRIEGEDRGLPAALAGQRRQAAQDAAVADVHAVEIADGEGAGTEIRRALRRGCGRSAWRLRRLHQDFQAVVGQADVRRQQAFGALVPQVVADVGEEGAPRRQRLPPS